jgi:hypothetical protein
MLQIVASLIDTARGVIYDHHMFIVQATVVINFVDFSLPFTKRQYEQECNVWQVLSAKYDACK